MTPDQRAELARERAVAEQELLALAAARRTAETAFNDATGVVAAAWRANQKRTRPGRYTAVAVASVTGIHRTTLANWAEQDGKDDKPERPDGDYSLDDFAALAAARQEAKDVFDTRSSDMAQAWRTIQNEPRTKFELLVVEKLTGVSRTTLRAWLTGDFNPYGVQRTRAKGAAAKKTTGKKKTTEKTAATGITAKTRKTRSSTKKTS